jgi:hypothetical protein
MYLVEKNHRVDRFTIYNYYHKISKYSYSFSIKHEHAHVIVVKNGGCNTSHSKRVEQAFYTKYTGK